MKRFWLFFAILMALWGVFGGESVQAAESSLTDDFLEELDLEKIDREFQDLKGKERIRFTDAVKKLIRGEIPMKPEGIMQIVRETLFSGLEESRSTAVRILVLLTAAALFSNFVYVFEKSQAADISFYMMYLCLFTLLMQTFREMAQMTMDALNQVIAFMKLLMPSYFLASVFASGSVTGAGFYELTLGMLLVVQWVLKYSVMPAVNLYVLFSMLNHLTKEDYLSKLAELLKTYVEWSLKTLTALAIGLQTVQTMILPAVDKLKTAAFTKTAGAVPGLGNIFSGVTEVVIGSAVLIKNAVGAAGLIFLVLLCLIPFLKLGFGSLFYRLLAAAAQPVSDKRMVECVSSVGEGAGLLMKILFMVGALFFISVAMVTASVTGG